MANSVSVLPGVSDTIFVGALASVTVPPSSSVSVSGYAGVGDGLGLGLGVDAAVGLAIAEAGAGWLGGPEKPGAAVEVQPATMARRATAANPRIHDGRT